MLSTAPIGSSPLHVCNACNQYIIRDDDDRISHYKSEWHRYNVKRRCAGLASITKELFDTQLAALQTKKQEEAADKVKQRCQVCNKTFLSVSSYQAHTTSKKHIKRLKEGNNNKDYNNNNNNNNNEIGSEESEEEEQKDGLSTATASLSLTGENDDSTTEDVDGEIDMDGEPIPLKTCLFCKQTFNDVESSVEHMLKIHGFFIPFVENLTDLNGMLEYLGEKIGIGHVCLYCNGRGRAFYPSTIAVQSHMAAKSHCKLRLDDEEDEEEFADFYTFPDDDEEDEDEEMEQEADKTTTNDKQTSDPNTALVVSDANPTSSSSSLPRRPRGLASMNDYGELVLQDGSIIGHRSLNRAYKQNVRPSTDDRIIHISQAYRSFAGTTSANGNQNTSIQLHKSAKKSYNAQHADWAQNKVQDTARRLHLKEGMAKNLQKHYRAQVNF